jgi:HK97 family phage major capsid protein
VETERTMMTIEERVARQSEVRSRLSELDSEYAGAELPAEARTEWNDLQQELIVNERAIADANQRREYLNYVNDVMPQQGERVDNQAVGLGLERAPLPQRMGSTGPALIRRPENIYDVQAIRQGARSIEEAAVLYHDYAMRAVEQARFPGAIGRAGVPSREDAQTRVANLLDSIDDEQSTLARRILHTGSSLYDRAFGKALARQSIHGLTAEEQRALQLGTDASGGFAVPFQLDPTVILTSSSVVNPLRAISRVETITGKEWDGLTSSGVTVTRGTESQEVGTADPAFAQPTVRTSRVMGWIPFSIELDVSWNALRSQMTFLLQDAKDIEEATAFATGNGTAPNPSGVVSTLGTASRVTSGGSAVIQVGDVYLLENAMAPRFLPNSSIVASKTIFNKFRSAFQLQASSAGDPFSRPTGNIIGEQFNGYPKYELSTMSATSGTADLVMLQGDFRQFLIVDRVGMGIELVPQLLGTNRRPTGERGVFALWFNNSKILVDNAFRLLQIKAT